MALRMNRRNFLRSTGMTVLVLSMTSLGPGPSALAQAPETAPASYGDWRDVYREKWTWDKVVRCSHTRVLASTRSSSAFSAPFLRIAEKRRGHR